MVSQKVRACYPCPAAIIVGVVIACAAMGASAQNASPDDLTNRLIESVEKLTPDEAALNQILTEIRERQPAPPAAMPVFPADALEFFETRIRPVLAEKCLECHTGDKPKAGLRLNTREGILAGSSDGTIVAPGDPNRSKLLNVLHYDGETKMPPSGRLPDDAIQAFSHWIALGLPWPSSDTGASAQLEEMSIDDRVVLAQQTHWAFKPVQNVAVPAVSRPEWVATPVDAFVLAKLDERSLQPSSEADKRTLIRRAYYDLIGLPPSHEEIREFERDPAPDAYAELIDRLLAMPEYGERWGRYWLDVARYADTRGYVFQSETNIAFSHTYRDYVVRAFNEDLPFDQFILHQLAADQLDLGEDKRPLAAMGFLTLGRIFLGVQDDIADDRIDVVTRGLLGLTVTCARCHDHKYDPIPAADYYSLHGVFRSSVEPGEPPLIAEPDPNNPDYQDYLKVLADRQKELEDLIDELHVGVLKHARESVSDYLLAAHDAKAYTTEDEFQALARDRKLRWQLLKGWQEFLKKKTESHDPVFAPWLAFSALTTDEWGSRAPELAKAIAGNTQPDKPVNPIVATVFEGDAPKDMGEVAQRYKKLFADVDTQWRDKLSERATAAERNAKKDIVIPGGLSDANAEAVRLALYGADSPASVPRGRFEELLDVPTQNRIRDRRNAVLRVESTHPGRPDRAMTLVDRDKPFDPYIYLRGKPENRGDAVPRQFLAVLTRGERKPFEKGSGRLELAQAIASKDNPLTARVFVNRVWLNHFGKALVETASDFGLRSEAPSHPELLDYLAWQFMENGWSVKSLHRLIMLSNTYRQSSAINDASYAIDPENRLVWRQNRRRLDFEAMRDSILDVAGTLDKKMGGPSVDITSPPFTTRRSIYSRIDRLNFPQIFRAFDFASPDMHSPKRLRTTVPQQALFMLNSPFVVEQARAVTKRPELAAMPSLTDGVVQLYRVILRRDPDEAELQRSLRFLSETTMDAPAPPWSYGYGRYDDASQKTLTFTPLPHYEPGQWRGGPQMPDPALGWVSLSAGGGHPGGSPDMSAIRRWRAEFAGDVFITGAIKRYSEMGDGVLVYIVSSRSGLLWTVNLPNGTADPVLLRTSVEPGDTIDFIVACGGNEGYDGFEWTPEIRRVQEGATFASIPGRMAWNAGTDFTGPMPAPLAPIEQLAQVLMLTNEFMFVD